MGCAAGRETGADVLASIRAPDSSAVESVLSSEDAEAAYEDLRFLTACVSAGTTSNRSPTIP
jgi:hypothetical protein